MALSSQSPSTLPWVLVVSLILPFLELYLSGTSVQPVGLVPFTQPDTFELCLCCLITETALSWRLHRVSLSGLRAVVRPSLASWNRMQVPGPLACARPQADSSHAFSQCILTMIHHQPHLIISKVMHIGMKSGF